MVLVDASLGDLDDLVFQAGTHEDAIRVKYCDWTRLMGLLVESFTEPSVASRASMSTSTRRS